MSDARSGGEALHAAAAHTIAGAATMTPAGPAAELELAMPRQPPASAAAAARVERSLVGAVPAGQSGAQLARDAVQVVPGGQGAQADAFVAPLATLYEPAGQSSQAAAPAARAYEPGGHGAQTALPANADAPGGQRAQAEAAPAPRGTLPAGHVRGTHMVGSVAPGEPVVSPSPHGMHTSDTLAALAFTAALQAPSGHERQLSADERVSAGAPDSAHVPRGHGVHCVCPGTAAKKPGAQPTQATLASDSPLAGDA